MVSTRSAAATAHGNEVFERMARAGFAASGLLHVLIAVIVANLLTRELFGYSFATWRFHLRGETIRSATDIGWILSLIHI